VRSNPHPKRKSRNPPKKQSLNKVGGFQSGFTARFVSRDEAKFPQYLICNHDCKKVLQLISNVSKEPEFELCEVEAVRFIRTIAEALNEFYKADSLIGNTTKMMVEWSDFLLGVMNDRVR